MSFEGEVPDTALGATALLANFVAEWHPGSLPPAAAHEAKRALIDLLGVALAGSGEECSRLLAAVARREGPDGPAAIIGHGFRSSATIAALVNGTTAHALDFDDLGRVPASGHPTVALAPAGLAVAEFVGTTGRRLLEALIVGYEVVVRLGSSGAGEIGEIYGRGFHGTSVFGVFGAAATAARVLELDAHHVGRAFGIAASGAKGVRANYGTMTKPLHAGEANRTGVLAAMLARDGFTASSDVIEAPLGWANAMAPNSFRSDEITAQLGERLAIETGVRFKQFPTGGGNHEAIRGVLQIITEHALDSADIQEIVIESSDLVATLAIPWPTSALAGKFSLRYNVAAAWADGRITHETFTDAKIQDLEPYRARVRINCYAGPGPVTVRVRHVDGRELVREESSALGQNQRLSDAEIRSKFLDNVCAVRDERIARSLLDVVDDLENITDLRELGALLL